MMNRNRTRSNAFTLVELMVSIAIAMLLVLAINSVFQTASQTVGAGEAALGAARAARTLSGALEADFEAMLPFIPPTSTTNYQANPPAVTWSLSQKSAPAFIIRSEHAYAFRNVNDQPASGSTLSTPDTDTSVFPAAFWPNSQAPVPLIHYRSHRIDQLGFFVSQLLYRQTSSDNANYVALNSQGLVPGAQTSWVMYGHCWQPNNQISNQMYFFPGAQATSSGVNNDNNFYACDWLLTRFPILLDGNFPTDTGLASTTTSTLDFLATYPPTGTNASMSPIAPLGYGTTSYQNLKNGAAGYSIDNGRYDVANVFANSNNLNPPSTTALSYVSILNNYIQGLNGVNPMPPISYNSPAWYDQMLGYRIQASANLVQDPNGPGFALQSSTGIKISPYGVAKSAPCLTRGCTQFIVEYAGNYYTKKADGTANPFQLDANGNPTNTTQTYPVPDPRGIVDFYTNSITGAQQIRWYGFPRSVTGGFSSTGTPLTSLSPTLGDVVPLRDILSLLFTNLPNPAAYYADAERFEPSGSSAGSFPPAGSNYWSVMNPTNDDVSTTGTAVTAKTTNNSYQSGASGTPPSGFASGHPVYYAAWGPDIQNQAFPKLIRITVGIDDRNGRLAAPQMFEFIFKTGN